MDDDAGEPITIEVALVRSDMVAAERVLARRSELRRLRRLHGLGQLVAMGGLFVLSTFLEEWVGGYGMVPLFAYVALALMWVSGLRKVSRDLRPSSVTVDELGYTSTTAGIVSRVPWTAPLDIEATSEHIVLRVALAYADVWPRRCFAPGDAERVLAWARAARQRF